VRKRLFARAMSTSHDRMHAFPIILVYSSKQHLRRRREIILFSDVEVEMKNMDHVENIFERMQALNCVFSVCVCGRASETQEVSLRAFQMFLWNHI
jgi:hypothetical protein